MVWKKSLKPNFFNASSFETYVIDFQILLKIAKNLFLVLMNIVSCHSTKNQLFFSFANAAIV